MCTSAAAARCHRPPNWRPPWPQRRAARPSSTARLANVAQARATLSSNETNLSKASIRSPIDGVVLSRAVEPGNAVAASLQAVTLFTLAEDLTKMKLQVNVDEADVGQVQRRPGRQLHRQRLPDPALPGAHQARGLRLDDQGQRRHLPDRAERQQRRPVAAPGHDGHRHHHHRRAQRRAAGAQRGAALHAGNRRGAQPPAAGNSIVSSMMPRPPRSGGTRRAGTDTAQVRQVWVLRGRPAARRAGDARRQRRAHDRGDERATAARHGGDRRADRGRREVNGVPRTPADPPARRDPRLRPGLGRGAGAARRRPGHRRRRVRRHHGAQRLGQVDGDEHHRLPRLAQRRRPTCSAASPCTGWTATSARCCAARTWASSSRASTCWRAPARWRTSSCRCCTAASRRAARHEAAREALAAVGLAGREDAHAGGAVRRPAAARGDRARAGHEPDGAARRRADRQPRHAARARDHGTARRTEPRPRHHRADGHARARHGGLRAAHRALRRRAASRATACKRRWPRYSGAGALMWWNTLRPGAARDPPQPAALVPDHPGHRDRRRRGDHDGDHRPRRDAGRLGPDHQPGHQPADGAPGPAPGRGARRRRVAALPPGRRRRDRGAGGGRAAGRPAGVRRRSGGLRRAQLVDRGLRQHQRLLRDQQLDAGRAAGCSRTPSSAPAQPSA